ncbi:Inorganic diphosphatase [Desulforamulus reducens MI-1]|uniref:inorganic diphosphatase n=1 Tax=Desulforamulus reducens (strain ATCC BAA-1160 / DSM 100696 / MI-1) TaxID=349161 RepID=A4J6B1_DESRM|nr:putative manganese-dependent inorganic diphosphatase [Desulforamulus reducens]ABO50614.1 Inorganic diphosphatase [Desulforamulus reducens MI-1]
MTSFIVGHKNPDTDSVASAIGLSYLKNCLGFDTIPCSLGKISKETEFVLNHFGLPTPIVLGNVKTQVKDLECDRVIGIAPSTSILSAYKLMEQNNMRTLPVVDDKNRLQGILTIKDIAMELIRGDFYRIDTSLDNIVKDFNGEVLVGEDFHVTGKVSVIAYYYKNIQNSLGPDDIIIVGDRYDILECAIRSQVKLIIITGHGEIPEVYLEMAQLNNVAMITVPVDTYTTSKLINQCNSVSLIMKKSGIVKFKADDYLDEVKEEILNTNYRNYPVVNHENVFQGFINKKQIINPGKKKVILVDHNEYSQSAEGLNEAEILEIVDHHKIGDICTTKPIAFRNMPVGSTCTIVYQMFKEFSMDVTPQIAGVLLAGILSDTLLFKSPTTTALDKDSVAELNKILQLDVEKFAMDMFKMGSSLEGFTIKEIFYRDFKEFDLEGSTIGVGQVFTLDIEDVFNRKKQFFEFVEQTHQDKSYFLTMLVITDIINEGSYLLYQARNNSLISTAFQVSAEQGVFVSGLVSRKKQVIPKILEAINLLK